MKNKRVLLIAVIAVLAVAACVCWFVFRPEQKAEEGKKLSIVATIFPEYDWVKNILGDNPGNIELTMLLDTGVDLHSYQPTVNDVMKVSKCDLFIYVGGESDKWVDDVLSQASNQDMVAISLLDALGDQVRKEEILEGMESEEEEEEEGGESEYDEHVWLSLRNAALLVKRLEEAIAKIDPDHADVYRANAEAYIAKLGTLDQAYRDAVAGASVKTLLFADRFPFRYLTDDYGLTPYAAFAGCSAETSASFGTIRFLASKVDELSLRSVIVIEGGNHGIAEAVVENTQTKDQRILTMDSMQSVTAGDVSGGADYLGIMEKNLSVLKDALQ